MLRVVLSLEDLGPTSLPSNVPSPPRHMQPQHASVSTQQQQQQQAHAVATEAFSDRPSYGQMHPPAQQYDNSPHPQVPQVRVACP